jgi:hypothetical protein
MIQRLFATYGGNTRIGGGGSPDVPLPRSTRPPSTVSVANSTGPGALTGPLPGSLASPLTGSAACPLTGSVACSLTGSVACSLAVPEFARGLRQPNRLSNPLGRLLGPP